MSRESAPRKILEFFQSGLYASQGREHIDTVSNAFLEDLLDHNETLANAAASGEIVHERNFTTATHQFSRDIDLVIGTSRNSNTASRQLTQSQLESGVTTVREGSVKDVWLALNVESLISGVGKNWKNRGEDVYVFYLSVYEKYNLAATGSIMLLNVGDLEQRDPEEMIAAFREFDFADGSIAQSIDSLAIIPLDYDETAPAETEIVNELVPPDHPLNYQSFIRVMADSLARRLDGEFEVSSASLESILAKTETEVLEFKEELNDLSDIAKEAVAFANNDGGSILIGAQDDGSVTGIEDIDAVEERVTGILENVEPAVIRNIEKAKYEGKDILIINVSRATSVPASYNGMFYVRRGTSKNRMTGQEILQKFPRS